MSDLRDEGTEEARIELGLLESVVDAKGLGREGAAALETEEALDGSAVASAMEAALEAPAMMVGRARGAVGTRAEARVEAHGSPFSPAWPEMGSFVRPAGSTAVAGECGKNQRRARTTWTAVEARFPTLPLRSSSAARAQRRLPPCTVS